jgi:hypothetical protein
VITNFLVIVYIYMCNACIVVSEQTLTLRHTCTTKKPVDSQADGPAISLSSNKFSYSMVH